MRKFIPLLALISLVLYYYLGQCNPQYMVAFGVGLSVVSSTVTIIICLRALVSTRKLPDFLRTPLADRKMSYSFNNLGEMFSKDQSQIGKLEGKVKDISSNFDARLNSLEFSRNSLENHVALLFDQIRFHESVTLKKILAADSMPIIFGAVFAMLGTVVAGYPALAQKCVQTVNSAIIHLFWCDACAGIRCITV